MARNTTNVIRVTIKKDSPCYRILMEIAERTGFQNPTDVVAMVVSLFGKYLLMWLDGNVPMLATNAVAASFPASFPAPNPAALVEEEHEEYEEPEEPEEFGGL